MKRAFAIAALSVLLATAAHADPALPRVLAVPTAWLPPAGAVVTTAGIDRHGAAMADLDVGLGGLASIEVGLDSDTRGCAHCTEATSLSLGRAAFRIGARQNELFRGAPALVLGLRTTFSARGHEFGEARVSEASVVASSVYGPVRLHVGGQLTEAAFGDRTVHMEPRASALAGLEWTPPIYPRTTVLADMAWAPQISPTEIDLKWLAGWGVRYQAFAWGSVELAVRHRQDEGLGQSDVMIRMNGVFTKNSR
ncbi:MAG TPA: hypothetical protein VGM90_40445 [Kofleriaceae bacterium]|jgi:hypothetical protein